MTGVRITITVNDRELRETFRRLAQFTTNMKPVLEDIGNTLVNSTSRRFEAQVDPDGQPWKELSPAYARAKPFLKPPRINKILQGRGRLRDSIHWEATDDSVLVGTNAEYAAIHQFGGTTSPHVIRPKRGKALAWKDAKGNNVVRKKVNHPGSKIPARPFLGVGENDRERILLIIQRAILKELGR